MSTVSAAALRAPYVLYSSFPSRARRATAKAPSIDGATIAHVHVMVRARVSVGECLIGALIETAFRRFDAARSSSSFGRRPRDPCRVRRLDSPVTALARAAPGDGEVEADRAGDVDDALVTLDQLVRT